MQPEGLGFYVYALRDPRDGAVFYIGKGIGERVYDHVRAALSGRTTARQSTGVHPAADPAGGSAKSARIRAITAAGHTVEHLILRSGSDSDEHAYLVEQAVLDGYAATGVLAEQLTNLVGGHHSATHGLASVEAAAARVAAPVARLSATGRHLHDQPGVASRRRPRGHLRRHPRALAHR